MATRAGCRPSRRLQAHEPPLLISTASDIVFIGDPRESVAGTIELRVSGDGAKEREQRCAARTDQVGARSANSLGDIELQQLQRAVVG
jgi:hypothetical protein